MGEVEEAITHFSRAVQFEPKMAGARHNLAVALLQDGRTEEAVTHLVQALEISPNDPGINNHLGIAFGRLGRIEEAGKRFSEAIRIDPHRPGTYKNLGFVLNEQGRTGEAIEQFRQALRLHPGWPEVANDLAWIHATCADPSYRDGEEAVRLAELATAGTDNSQPAFLDTLAAAYAEAGRFEQAIRTAEQAINLARSKGETKLAEGILARQQLYQAHKPFRENGSNSDLTNSENSDNDEMH